MPFGISEHYEIWQRSCFLARQLQCPVFAWFNNNDQFKRESLLGNVFPDLLESRGEPILFIIEGNNQGK
jgi:hypothetical protein